MVIKRREIIAIGFVIAGFAIEAFSYTSAQSGLLRGIGGVALLFGIAIEIVGYAIYGEKDN